MPKRRRDGDTESVISVTPSKLLRRRKRAEVLRRIIYLKRRTIRCYFVNVFFAFIQIVIHVHLLYYHWPLFQKHLVFLLNRGLFVLSLVLTLLGSVLAINALSKETKKVAFFGGNLLFYLGVAINAVLITNIFIHILPREPKYYYGYPKDMVEDCEAYPDHVFKFFVKPESLKGRPIVESMHRLHAADVEDDEDEDDEDYDETTTLETEGDEEVTEQYNCEEMLSNIKYFQVTNYFAIATLVITGVTLILSLIGIIHLWSIHLKGLNYSILPPVFVEPYEFYDDLMLHNHSLESIPGLNTKTTGAAERVELKKKPNREKEPKSNSA